jgi:hypothetical protein
MTTNIRARMEALLDESAFTSDADVGEEAEVSLKSLIPQLVLTMQAHALDPHDEGDLDYFLKMLKTLSTTKAPMVKSAIKQWSGAKAGKALRVMKKAV